MAKRSGGDTGELGRGSALGEAVTQDSENSCWRGGGGENEGPTGKVGAARKEANGPLVFPSPDGIFKLSEGFCVHPSSSRKVKRGLAGPLCLPLREAIVSAYLMDALRPHSIFLRLGSPA